MTLTFTVIGDPKPKGSYRAYTYRRSAAKGGGMGARVDNDNTATKAWQRTVGVEAQTAMRRAGWTVDRGPLRIVVRFCLPRPVTVKRPYPVAKPDLDKLQRALLDGLKGVVYVDDAQVVAIQSQKVYAASRDRARAEVTISPIAQSQLFVQAKESA